MFRGTMLTLWDGIWSVFADSKHLKALSVWVGEFRVYPLSLVWRVIELRPSACLWAVETEAERWRQDIFTWASGGKGGAGGY